MSPQFISSFYRRSPSPPTSPGRILSVEDARSLLARTGSVLTYHGQEIDYDVEDDPPFFYHDYVDRVLETSSASDGDEAPPSTQPRPDNWRIPPGSEGSEVIDTPDWAMEHFICLRYRSNAIWLRINIVIENMDSRGSIHPRVTVQLVNNLSSQDPIFHRVGLVIEQALQEGLRREVIAATSQLVDE
ncbi:hypothetical protein GSI_13698 [Ganoderma sinense ZZ0214-1]|uniref:Uncharacterized protein n=1 Tax=Ganoderma sinense ZZ0214-1 TaxID=1077348 RepID=A0A2G8RR11_9APHY|nr:hypothetical protein GSI_13698 [Ganoderma sinense ZZ0214-1]